MEERGITLARITKHSPSIKSCPVATVQSLISGKWKMMILYLLSQNTRRFNELQRLLNNDISQTILTNQLRELENDGLVHREVYKEIPPKVEYSLTELGWSFIPVLKNMGEWGTFYKKSIEDYDVNKNE